MQLLRDWTARRAGASMTIQGVDNDTGQVVKITQVDRIFPTASGVIAQLRDGKQFRLAAPSNL